MTKDSTTIWIAGVAFPIVAWWWAVSTFLSREVEIPVRNEHLSIRGQPAICIAIALICAGFALHFAYFWCLFPKSRRLSTRAAICACWATAILLAAGIVWWCVVNIAEFFR